MPATNLDRQLAQLTIGHQNEERTNPVVNAGNGNNAYNLFNAFQGVNNGVNTPVADLLDIPGMFPVQERVVASEPPDLLGMSTGNTSAGTTSGTGNTVNVANGIGHPVSISSARSVPAAFSYIWSPEVPSFAVIPTNNQPSILLMLDR